MGGVLPAGAAMAAGYSSAALLGKEITGSGAWGTLAAACLTIGGTLATVPLAGYMSRHGRRRGLRLAWAVAFCGTASAFTAAVTSSYPLLVIGILGIGVGNAANLSARYAASDLATDQDRAKAIGTLVWSTSFGSALGPTLGLGVVGSGAAALGLPELAGPYLMGMVLFVAAAVFIDRNLHPDPLAVAGGLTPVAEGEASGGRAAVRDLGRHLSAAGGALGDIARHPSARLAVLAMLVGQAVMVAIMTATPLHMSDGAHEIRIIGFVISVHIIGMYFFAPVAGLGVDRFGPRPMIALGGVVLFVGAELASHTRAEDSVGVFSGLFLIGLGWSIGLVAGSALLTGSFPVERRVLVQGSADLVMSGAGAVAGLSAGIVYEWGSYHALSHHAGLGALGLTAYALWRVVRGRGTAVTVSGGALSRRGTG
jgi:MFS family permease